MFLIPRRPDGQHTNLYKTYIIGKRPRAMATARELTKVIRPLANLPQGTVAAHELKRVMYTTFAARGRIFLMLIRSPFWA